MQAAFTSSSPEPYRIAVVQRSHRWNNRKGRLRIPHRQCRYSTWEKASVRKLPILQYELSGSPFWARSLYLRSFGGCISDGERSGNTGENPATTGANEGEKNGSTDAGEGTGGAEEDEPPISERFDCTEADRPTPDVAEGVEHEMEEHGGTTVYESVGSTEYPTPPSAFDEDTVGAFIEEHERTDQQNEFVERRGDNVVDFEVMIENAEIFDFHDEITTVRLDFAVHYEVVHEDVIEMTEPVGETVVYAIDETGFIRTETDYRGDIEGAIQEGTPDPLRDGELLGCFRWNSSSGTTVEVDFDGLARYTPRYFCLNSASSRSRSLVTVSTMRPSSST